MTPDCESSSSPLMRFSYLLDTDFYEIVFFLSHINVKQELKEVGLPSDPLAETPSSQCKRPGFDPWLGT